MATKLIKDLPLVETLTDTDAVLIQTDNGTQRASLAQIKEVSKGDRGEKGEQGEKGDSGIMPSDMVDYMGNQHETLKAKNDSDVEYILGEVNTVHYEGQHITAIDTIERQVRSAILKGCTLVNISKFRGELVYDSAWKTLVLETTYPITENTKYFISFNLSEDDNELVLQDLNDNTFISHLKKGCVKGINNFTITTSSNANKIQLRAGSKTGSIIKEVMIIPYQDGMENWDIPYFEGMQSVRMPVLKAIGKNLFDINKCISGKSIDDNGELIDGSSHQYAIEEFIKIDNTITTSVVSDDGIVPDTTNGIRLRFYDKNKKLISSNWFADGVQIQGDRKKRTFTVNGAEYLRLNISASGGGADTSYEAIKTIQIENGSSMTSYEPHKTNILSVPLENHKGFNGVYDTVDCITGEVVERIGEIVFDGSESWGTASEGDTVNGFSVWVNIEGAYHIKRVICDKLPYYDYSVVNDITQFITCLSQSRLIIINIKGLTSVDEVKQWLSENPITVQYQLAESTIKTVDLNNQKVYSYDGTTHYTCSSEEGSLVPTLSIDVPTNLPVLVSRQRATIAEQSQTLAEQEEAQNILIESQLSWYEATAPVTLNLTDEVLIPEYIQKLYKLAYERGIRDSSNAIIEQDLRID